jgi:hypothetical protein
MAEEVTGEHRASTLDKSTGGHMTRGTNSELQRDSLRRRMTRATLATLTLLLAGSVQLCLARPLSQATFPSPEDASRALLAAVQRRDEPALTKILGARPELLTSGDTIQDSLERERFVQKYQQMHRLVQQSVGVTALYIGAENWPFPIPLVSRGGVWRFDPDSGADEIRFRRIGENEVTAIGICHALLAAQTHPAVDSEADGLLRTLLPNAQQPNNVVPFHGYNFRILSKSGSGFAAIAYPAVYRSSGVLTFLVNQDDVVYEKDLGPKTAIIAAQMTLYQSDPTWTSADSAP